MIKAATLILEVLPVPDLIGPPVSRVIMMTVSFLDARNAQVGETRWVGFKSLPGRHSFNFQFDIPVAVTGIMWEYYYENEHYTPEMRGVSFALHHVGHLS